MYLTLDDLIKQRLRKCGPELDLVHNAVAGYVKTKLGFVWYKDYSQLKQTIHNLKMRFPIGILSIDNAYDERLKQYKEMLEEVNG